MRHAPTLEFIHDALPENARHIEEILAQARESDAASGRGGRRRGVRRRGRPVPQAARGRRARRRRADDVPTRTSTRVRRVTEDVAGLVVVDKPAGLTSHDVVARVRRLAGTRKVGHAGTLDPMATGVLVLGVNRATRLLGHLTLTEKAYDATIRLGPSTRTDDAEGEVAGDRRRRRTSTEDDVALGRRPLRRRDRPGAVGGVGDQGRRRAGLRAGARRRGRRAAGPAR